MQTTARRRCDQRHYTTLVVIQERPVDICRVSRLHQETTNGISQDAARTEDSFVWTVHKRLVEALLVTPHTRSFIIYIYGSFS